MAKEDVIQMQGEIVEALPQRNLQGQVGEWISGVGAHHRQDADALHLHFAGRQGDG